MSYAAKLRLAPLALVFAASAQATPITGYDITNAALSGFGGWSHNYTGLIAGNNYSGGGGTLNDGLMPGNVSNNQLFNLALAPTITLHLAGLTNVSSIELFGGVMQNLIPGTLTGWSVTIGGNTMAFGSTATGGSCSSGLCDDIVSLVGSGLENIATDTIVLQRISGRLELGSTYFNIAEIQVGGQAATAAVPEPASAALTLAGLGGLLAVRRTRRKQ